MWTRDGLRIGRLGHRTQSVTSPPGARRSPMRRHRDVAEQVVVVHGAASSVGRATVLEALARRARVAAVDTDASALAALEVEAATPQRLETVVVDGRAGETETARCIAYATTARFGLLHTLVHV